MSQEQQIDASPAASDKAPKEGGFWLPLVAIILATFVSVLSSSLVSVALPTLSLVFGVSTSTIQWVATGFMLASAVVIPASSYLSTTLGTKQLLVLSVGGFTIGSLLCGMAWNDTSLIAFRIFQGFTGGFIMPVGMAVMYTMVPPKQIGLAMGVWGIAAMVAPALGPTLGGAVIQYFNWRLLFFLNVPIGLIATAACYFLIKGTPKQKGGKFDIPGAIFSVTFFGVLLFALSKAPTEGWTSFYILRLFFVAAVSLALLLWAELTREKPLMNLSVLKNIPFSTSVLSAGLVTVSMMGSTFLMPIYLQNILGLTPMQSGILMLPQAVVMALMMPISGKLLDRVGIMPLGLTGLVILGVTTMKLYQLTADTPMAWINGVLIIRAVGIGICMMPISTTGMQAVPKHQISDASSLSNVLRQVMSSMGVAVLTGLMSSRQYHHYFRISENVPSTSDTATQVVSALSGFITQSGMDAASARTVAAAQLAGIMQKEAMIRGIADTFFISAIPAFVCIPLLLLLLPKKAAADRQAPQAAPIRQDRAEAAAS